MHAVGKSSHSIPSKRSEKRMARKQLARWEDPNEPGLSKAAARGSEAGAAAIDGKGLLQGPVQAQGRTGSPVRVGARRLMEAGPAPAGDPAYAAAAPRKSLCSRTTKWLAGITGLAMIGLASRYAGVLLPAASSTQGDPLEGLPLREATGAERPSPQAEKLAQIADTLPTLASTPLAPAPVATTAVDLALTPVAPRTLTQAIDHALTSGGKHAIETLSLQLGARWPQRGIPVETVKRMVDAYRHSAYWRQELGMENFLDGLMLAIGSMRMSDEQLQQLLKVWSWHYGEAREVTDKSNPLQPKVLCYSFAFRLAQGLGGRLIPESQLRLLIGAACREPEDTVPETILDRTLAVHAAWATSALVQVMHAISIPQMPMGLSYSRSLVSDQARRCLKIFLQGTSEDPRWKYLVLDTLYRVPPAPPGGTIGLDENWQDLVLSELQRYLAETVPSLEPRPTISRALTALYDPGLLLTGQVIEF